MTTKKVAKEQAEGLVALTVKVDSKLYVKLSTHRAKTRQTAQEILTEALRQYLAREGA
jgi:predicted transcriptional regulator